MIELTVFAAAFLGSVTGLAVAVVPLVYYARKKLKNYNPMEEML